MSAESGYPPFDVLKPVAEDLWIVDAPPISVGGLPLSFPWQAPTLTAVTQLLNAVGALFLVMAMSRGKASIVAPVTNALAPVLTIVLSLIVFQTLPTGFQLGGIVLALVGSSFMVYSSEKTGEAPLVTADPRVTVRETE